MHAASARGVQPYFVALHEWRHVSLYSSQQRPPTHSSQQQICICWLFSSQNPRPSGLISGSRPSTQRCPQFTDDLDFSSLTTAGLAPLEAPNHESGSSTCPAAEMPSSRSPFSLFFSFALLLIQDRRGIQSTAPDLLILINLILLRVRAVHIRTLGARSDPPKPTRGQRALRDKSHPRCLPFVSSRNAGTEAPVRTRAAS